MTADDLARAAPGDRADLFRETAARMGGVRALIVEKDFWVCWVLAQLFDPNAEMPASVFKGGTSLSKAYGLIHRFSEDIDLAFDRSALGFGGDEDPLGAPTANQAKKRLKRLDQACVEFVRERVYPYLQERAAELNAEADGLHFDPAAPAIRIEYPRSLEPAEYGQLGYISPSVLLELGARSDQSPSNIETIRPYAAEHFPELLGDSGLHVNVLAPERTFWEKATLLHVEPNRAPESRSKGWARLSRHAYDIFMLSTAGVAGRAVAQPELLEAVAVHKAVFFRSGWADYSSARPGTLRLAPTDDFERALRADYRSMTDMLFGDPPSWSQVLEELTSLESEINATA